MSEQPTPAMQKFLIMSQQLHARQMITVDGFAAAFYNATGLPPEQAEMKIERHEQHNHITGEHTVIQKIWFQKRGAP